MLYRCREMSPVQLKMAMEWRGNRYHGLTGNDCCWFRLLCFGAHGSRESMLASLKPHVTVSNTAYICELGRWHLCSR